MAENNINPSAPPAQSGQADGTPPEGGQPPAAGNDQPSGGVNKPNEHSLSLEEINELKRKAGRWDAQQARNRKNRRNNRDRRQSPTPDIDGADPELLESLRVRDEKINELSSVNIKLAVKDKVRDLLEQDEYKELSQGVRRAIIRNPLGFATPDAQTVEDAVADIQDYLDDELDALITNPPANKDGQDQNGGAPEQTPTGENKTPPASGSGPSNPAVDPNQGTEGLSGSKRSTLVLQNLLKKK